MLQSRPLPLESGSLAITPEFLRAADGKLFEEGFANLETLTTGEWWKRPGNNGKPAPGTQVRHRA